MIGCGRRSAKRLCIGGLISFVAFFPYALACLLVDGQFSKGMLPVIGVVMLLGGEVTAGVGVIWLERIALTQETAAEYERLAEMKARRERRSA